MFMFRNLKLSIKTFFNVNIYNQDEGYYNNTQSKCQWKQDANKNNPDLFTLTNEEYSQRYMSWTRLKDIFTKKGMYKRKRNKLQKLKKYRRRTPPIWFYCWK